MTGLTNSLEKYKMKHLKVVSIKDQKGENLWNQKAFFQKLKALDKRMQYQFYRGHWGAILTPFLFIALLLALLLPKFWK